MAVAGAIEGTTTDLVVVGSGAAGLTGALVAALGGARVTLLEKTDLIGGTTAISGGGAWVPCNPVMGEIGLHDTREDALTYLRACTGGRAEDDMLEAMVDRGADMVRALQDAGIPWQAWPATGGAIDYRGWLPGAMRGGRTLALSSGLTQYRKGGRKPSTRLRSRAFVQERRQRRCNLRKQVRLAYRIPGF